MIGKLSGRVELSGDHAIVDVGGVGYLVQCPTSTLSRLTTGSNVSLFIETRITDETIRLYGFVTAEEREWFRLLQTVQNVGARVALNVLSSLPPRELARAIALGDKAMVGRAQGVGPKLALRIVTELKDKVPAMMLAPDDAVRLADTRPSGPEADAVLALVKLGYAQGDAAEAVARAARAHGDEAGADILIRESLRAMGR